MNGKLYIKKTHIKKLAKRLMGMDEKEQLRIGGLVWRHYELLIEHETERLIEINKGKRFSKSTLELDPIRSR